MQNLTEKIDQLFAENRGKEAEALLETCLKEALREGRQEEAVPILNELIGYCRETSQVEKSYAYADHVLQILKDLQMQNTIPFATTLLNIANAYRAGGRLEDSLTAYEQAAEIYGRNLNRKDMLFASLYNNISLLYQEMGRFEFAREALVKALEIVEEKEDTAFEIAVTYANLAATELQLGKDEDAQICFDRAIRIFEENDIRDTHYCAALSSLAMYHYRRRDYRTAERFFRKAMEGIEAHLGQNEYYLRMKENAEICRQAYEGAETESGPQSGLAVSRAYYETYGKPMLETCFPEYLDKIAVGLVGEGSDCFGYDDVLSRDHDWGPSFCMWITRQTYEEIGVALQAAYDGLPKEFLGYCFYESAQGKNRRGVLVIEDFYRGLLGANMEKAEQPIMWDTLEDYALATAVNGEVFTDPEGIFTQIRNRLLEEYPERLRYIKLAESLARFCQNGQYNFPRVTARGDIVTGRILLYEAVKEALKILYYVEREYPPHDKWLFHGIKVKGKYGEILELLEQEQMEPTAEYISHLLYKEGYISDTESYLDVHVAELLFKSGIADLEPEELADRIAHLEFEAFDRVKNLGGRADCQDDWMTFSIMRKSQYLTWNHSMLMQYYYDFCRETERGHNLIEEKYGRMMASTAPEEYEAMKERFPIISSEKKEIIETIVEMQVKWMEEFAKEYPYLAGNARSIHTYEDSLWNTSYETYLRGEISTYSDKMLELYGRYIVELSAAGENPARKIMEQSVLMYGYEGLKDAEEGLRKQEEAEA